MGGRKVVGVIAGDAWSAAFYVLQSCDERLMFPLTSILVHEPWFDGAEAETSTQKLVTGQFAKHLEKLFFVQLSIRTGRTVKFYQDKVRSGEWFLDPDAALAEGFVDRILTAPPFKVSPAIPLPKRKKSKPDESSATG
jgi:ATP-dependent protease ClpP protease subunit